MTKPESIRVIIADDHKLFRSGIISLLDDEPNIHIISEAENGQELIDRYLLFKPDIMLIDISMPIVNGVEAFKTIKKDDSDVKALFLTMYEGEEYIYYAMKIGAKGLLGKNTMKGELVYAIKTVNEGNRYFGKNYNEERLKKIEKKYKQILADQLDDFVQLTETEKKILEYISKGMTSQEIADALDCGKKNVDYHRSKVMQRLAIKTLPELISYSVRFSMVNKLFES
jgi:DNA-binding NarL/FixJ family response regulator